MHLLEIGNVIAADDDRDSPSTYVGEAYKEYRKNEKRKREKKEGEDLKI